MQTEPNEAQAGGRAMQPERIGCGRGRLCSAVATILGLPRFSPTSVRSAAPALANRRLFLRDSLGPRPPGDVGHIRGLPAAGIGIFVRRHGGVTLRRRPSMNKASLARPPEKGGRIWGGNHD